MGTKETGTKEEKQENTKIHETETECKHDITRSAYCTTNLNALITPCHVSFAPHFTSFVLCTIITVCSYI